MTTKKTVFNAIKEMNEEELGKVLFIVYNAGWFDGAKTHIDREIFFRRVFLGMDADVINIDWENDDEVFEYFAKRRRYN